MKDDIFVNIAIDNAIKSYLTSCNDRDSLLFNSFNVVVIRILILIYGENEILNAYNTKNSVTFMNNLSKYGISMADLALFKEEFLNFYNFEQKNNKFEFFFVLCLVLYYV